MNELTQTLIVSAVAVVLVLLAIGALMLFKRLGEYLSIKSGSAAEGSVQRVLWTYAQLAYAWAEKEGKGLNGSEKADIAFGYLVRSLNAVGVNVNAEDMKAAIQKAWIVLEKVPRETGTPNSAQVQQEIQKVFEDTVKKQG